MNITEAKVVSPKNVPEYGELISRNGSPLLMDIHLNIVNYQNKYRLFAKRDIPNYLTIDHLHFDDFYMNGFITPSHNKVHSVTRDSFFPIRIERKRNEISILASPIQITDSEIHLLNSGKQFYVNPYFAVSQRFESWSLDTITFNLDKACDLF